MSGTETEWVEAAMSDDMMVVDLLVRLQAAAPPRHSIPPTLEWSIRQRRSRPASAVSVPKKQYPRASPTTPLTWSSATSLSGGSGGGGDESSSLPRSKVHGHRQRSASKRTRKKKTLAELKDDESMHLKERRQLKMQLAAMRLSLEQQKATNQSLNRIKIELKAKESISPMMWDNGVRSGEPKMASSDSKFVLPDLNMPLEMDCGGELHKTDSILLDI